MSWHALSTYDSFQMVIFSCFRNGKICLRTYLYIYLYIEMMSFSFVSLSLFNCSLLILFCLPWSNMLKKSGQNDIWLIGQGTSYTALCWYPSCPRISSLWEMQRQATVTKPLGIWVCANRLAQFVPLALRTHRASTGQSQGQALSLGTASVPPYHLLITNTP